MAAPALCRARRSSGPTLFVACRALSSTVFSVTVPVPGAGTQPAKIGRMPTKEQVTEKLTAVIDPELRRSIVDLGMVRSIEIGDDGRVAVTVSLTTPGCPIRS